MKKLISLLITLTLLCGVVYAETNWAAMSDDEIRVLLKEGHH